MLKEVVDFSTHTFKIFFYPDMFRYMFAILRASWVPGKILKYGSVLLACAGYDPSHVAKLATLILYQALTTPWGWQPCAQTCLGRNILERINKKKSTTSLNICWSYCKRCYKMLGPTIKTNVLCNMFCVLPKNCIYVFCVNLIKKAIISLYGAYILVL
jgi:hypothetical protein